jgi:hypothetical protein
MTAVSPSLALDAAVGGVALAVPRDARILPSRGTEMGERTGGLLSDDAPEMGGD